MDYADGAAGLQVRGQRTEDRGQRTEDKGQRISSIFAEGVVRITVEPTLAGLRRSDDRMSSGVRVFAGVTIR